MMTDDSVLEWALGWLRESPPDDPTFRQRFLDALSMEMTARRVGERARVCIWLQSEDARRYTECGPLVASAIERGEHLKRLAAEEGK
jgi:hypothetical protein